MTIKDWIQIYARELEGSDAERELMKAVRELAEESICKDRKANAEFWKSNIDKMFDKEISIYSEQL